MTFEEWAEENWMYIDLKNNARVIWDAAAKAEREACAKTCEQADKSTHPTDLADMIRARSN